MVEQIRISAKNLGAAALPDFCPRCFWLRLRNKLPFQIFPGIFSSIDSYNKRIVHSWFNKHNRPPDWMRALGDIVGYRDEHGTKAAALEEQRRKAPSPEELERFRNNVTTLEAAAESHRSALGTLDREMARLEGQIQNAGGDGIGETVETLREARELEQREVERHKERVATLQLLKNTIETCYQEQRDRLDAPLRRHLQPFLGDVFPSAELQLGDDFAVAGLKRSGPTAETFERLSAGTQEQLAVLVRLAMGALLCERSQEVPVILDDALVFSDDARIEQMFAALNRAGERQQVIVLTCRTRTFETLHGQRLSITSGTELMTPGRI